MERFFIITNAQKDPGLHVTETILRYLSAQGCTCQACQTQPQKDGTARYTDPEEIPEKTQCILVLGGDGTLLQAARDVVYKGVPLLGINLGTLGYLAEVDRKTLYPALDKLLKDDYELEERMMLQGEVYRGEEKLGQDIALNDIILARDGHLRVVRFNNFVNGEYLNSYDADATILSTPTGSTGYSLSAGGPLVSPNARLTIMTAVAPHTLNTRSIILPPEDIVTVQLGEGRRQDQEYGLASFDGDTAIKMVTGDKLIIREAPVKTRIVKLSHQSFVEAVRLKMY